MGASDFTPSPSSSPSAAASDAGRARPAAGAGTKPAGRPRLPAFAARWTAAALTLFVAVMAMPTPEGLSPEGHRAFALLVGVLALWITEALPLGVTVVIIVFGLLATQPGLPAEELLSGFASQTFFFLFAVLGIGAAVAESGLSLRIAALIARTARARPRLMYWQLVAMLPVLPLVLPSAMTRNAVLIPIYRDLLGDYARPPVPGLPKALLLVLGVLNPMGSSVTLTGGTVSIAAAMLVGGVGWGRWFLSLGVIYIGLIAVGAAAVYVISGLASRGRRTAPAPDFREPVPSGPNAEESGAAGFGPWSAAEKRTAAVLAGALCLWLTDGWHGWPPVLPALAAVTALLMPGEGSLPWGRLQARLSWTALLTMGGVLSLADALQRTGAVAWLADRFLAVIGGWALSEAAVYMMLAVVTIVIHLAVPGFVPNVSLMIPWAMALAPHVGAAPLAAAFIVTVATDSIIFYPVQATTSLMAYEQGQTTAKDVLVLGLVMTAALLAFIPLVILPYWRLIGLI